MTLLKSSALGAVFAVLSGTGALADCGIDAGRVSIIGNEFPAMQTIGTRAETCGTATLSVETTLTTDHQTQNLAGMTTDPAEFTAAIVSNASIVALIEADVIRPLDALIATYAPDTPERQLITIDGEVMAVAFMANAQTLVYRADILDAVGLGVPQSYEEVLAAAEAIREAGLMQYPVGGAYTTGWNLGQEFVNMYIGAGGAFFVPGTTQVAINNEQGVAALEMMQALTAYMNPDYLSHDNDAVAAEWRVGNVALMSMWGSRVGALLDGDGADGQVQENTVAAGPLSIGEGDVPATTLWWDGWTVAKNISDEDAAATFRALALAASADTLTAGTMRQAVWLMDGYVPDSENEGVLAAVEAGALPYPMLPRMGLLHMIIGDGIGAFLQGEKDAEQTLANIEAAYSAAAQAEGFLQ